jgi:mannose-6-phosphate isomerase-like protein (cupin superfamily)
MYNATDLIRPLIFFWNSYFVEYPDWKVLVKDIEPKIAGCGPVYEIPLPFKRDNESYAIADMRDLSYSAPHYHKETEIYFILEGSGLVVVGHDEVYCKKGDVIVTFPHTAHFVIPFKGLVLAVVNTPPFQGELLVKETNHKVKFDQEQFQRLKALNIKETFVVRSDRFL